MYVVLSVFDYLLRIDLPSAENMGFPLVLYNA
jgi:hypothetical protein